MTPSAGLLAQQAAALVRVSGPEADVQRQRFAFHTSDAGIVTVSVRSVPVMRKLVPPLFASPPVRV